MLKKLDNLIVEYKDFNLFCVENLNVVYYNFLTEEDFEFYYEKYLEYLGTLEE
jgi:hypothetical protein